MSRPGRPRIATIFGGSGFIGRRLVPRLAAQGYIVRVAVTDPAGARFLTTQGALGQIVPLAASVTDPAAVAAAVAGADLVVNLVGILHGDFAAIQQQGAAQQVDGEDGGGHQHQGQGGQKGVGHDRVSVRLGRSPALWTV